MPVLILLSGHSIKWEMSARYLGVYLESFIKFKCSFSKNKAGSFLSLLIAYLEKLAGAHQKKCCSSYLNQNAYLFSCMVQMFAR